jgi:hypothetical protein
MASQKNAAMKVRELPVLNCSPCCSPCLQSGCLLLVGDRGVHEHEKGGRAADWFKKVQEVCLSKASYLWKAVESIARPLELYTRLNKRAEFLPFCDAPVTMTRHCLHNCEKILSREDEDEKDNKPHLGYSS